MKGGPVLIVDDYADARATLREMVEEMGLRAVEAGDGQEAIDFLAAHPEAVVQLILLDLDMPRMTGWELLRLLKSYVRFATIPVVIVSRHTSYLRSKDLELIDGCFEAPNDIPRLRELIKTLTQH